jgi:DNA-binding SARP family transcriptional activator
VALIEHPGPAVKLTLFGGFEARAASGTVLRFRTKKTQALVAYLALEIHARHLRAKLAALLWGSVRDEQAMDSLRHALHDMRRVLRTAAPRALVICGESVAFDAAHIDVDVTRFEQLTGNGSVPAVHQAIAMYRGELLDGIVVDEEPFERWLAERRERVRAHAIRTLEKQLEAQSGNQRVEHAIETAQRLLAFDCAHEAVHRMLMRLYVEEGRRGAALRQYQLCVGSLQRELGTDPDEETRKLYESILRGGSARSPTRGADNEQGVPIVSSPSDKPCLDASVRHETPLIGRAAPMGELGRAVDAACRGHGHCVLVVGEAGIGKSRLVAEAALAARARMKVLQACAYETERTLPLGLWVDALRSETATLEIANGLDPAWRCELARLLPEVASASRKVATYGTKAEERRLFDAVRHFLLRLSERAPVVIVLDDLHWADEASGRLLAFVARRIASARILIIATLREEDIEQGATLRDDVSELVLSSSASKVELRGLSEPDTLELIRRLAYPRDGAPMLASTHARVWETSRGNPFMIVETLRAMREGTSIRPVGARALSDRVREVVVARIQRLAEPVQSVVAVAAVIGREFDFTLIAHAAQLAVRGVAASIEELVRRRILHATEDRFEFTHAWIREVIYASLLPSRCQLLHGQIALAYEQAGAGNDERLLSTLVHHYSLAKIWNKAAAYARQAGEQAFLRCAYAEAAALFENARVSLERLPRDAQVARETIDVRVRLHRSLLPTGIAAPTFENLREAEALLESADDPARRAQVLMCVSEYARWTGQYARAVDSGYRALNAACACGDSNLAAQARFHLGHAEFWKGRYRTAISILRQSVVDADLSLEPSWSAVRFPFPAIGSREILAYALASIGEFQEAKSAATQAIEIADAIADPFLQVVARRGFGLAMIEQGDFDNAVPLLERALTDCEQSHFDLLYSLLAGGLGYAYALSGRPDEGVSLMQRAVEQRRSLRGDYPGAQGAYLLTRLGEGCLLARRIADAAVYTERAADLARTYDHRIDEAWSLRLEGDLAARKGRSTLKKRKPCT